MSLLKMLSTDDKHAEIRRLYFQTTKQSINDDLAKALDLLKSMPSDDERERATVYMEGMAQMAKDWRGKSKKVEGKRQKGTSGRQKGEGKRQK